MGLGPQEMSVEMVGGQVGEEKGLLCGHVVLRQPLLKTGPKER